jgi:D-alanyl-lipoteichoic acid acyltransferase DltB (MBOAT superfamily)
MLFNSWLFIFLFLPVMLVGYFWLMRRSLILCGNYWLVGGSLVFYGYWNAYYVPLLLLSILVNFFVGSAISGPVEEAEDGKSGGRRHGIARQVPVRYLFRFGILFDVLLLGYFKYTDFFLENCNRMCGTDIPLPRIILPLGISFFTFTQIAFLVDAYKGRVKEYSLPLYMLFVTYFPHLIAGPILHHAEMMPQFKSRWNQGLKWQNVGQGLFLFSAGLFKKTVIADNFAPWANTGFDVAATLNFIEAWATSLSYTIQLYFDFSGYTDMAIGMSLMFNIHLPENFNSPYKALNIQDFWQRWHITLSRFLRDYIYIPLGGNKVGRLHHYLNLFAVFLIGGLWHGASWLFVLWGAMHGAAIVIHRIWMNQGLRMPRWLGWLITFNFVNIAWVFFRAKDFESVKKVLGGMVGAGGIAVPERIVKKLAFLQQFGVEAVETFLANMIDMRGPHLLILAGAIVFVVWAKNSREWGQKIKPTPRYRLATGIMLVLGILSLSRISQFLYFQF